jgi:hypothetical protein
MMLASWLSTPLPLALWLSTLGIINIQHSSGLAPHPPAALTELHSADDGLPSGLALHPAADGLPAGLALHPAALLFCLATLSLVVALPLCLTTLSLKVATSTLPLCLTNLYHVQKLTDEICA